MHNCTYEGVHMITIAVSLNKGGVGKSMLAKTLATQASKADLAVLILDMDSQQNSVSWGRRRLSKHDLKLPVVRFATEGDLSDEILRAREAGCDLIVIDTPPGRSSEALAAIDASDLVLIPFWNDQDSYDGVTKTFSLARRMGKEAWGVLNHCVPNSRVHAQTAQEVLSVIGLPMSPVVFHRYDVHRQANVDGLTAQEIEPESNAAKEVKKFWQWISAKVQI